MPYPTQTNREAIIVAAYQLIERDGAEQLTLAQLADALHIKAPSLYRHIPNKAALMQAVHVHTFDLLFAAYERAEQDAPADAIERLRMVLVAHRAFALAHPTTYSLAFAAAPTERPDARLLEQLVQPIQAIMAEIVGPAHALAALRGALALIHGFAMLEISGQLRREGDTNAAFVASIDAYLRGLTR